MALRISSLAVILFVFATAGSAWPALSLKSTMRSWKADAATMERLLTASGPFDGGQAASILQGFADDARSLAARVNATGGQARDIKSRFETFAGDAHSAIAGSGSRDKLRASYSQLRATCRSCHDVYAN